MIPDKPTLQRSRSSGGGAGQTKKADPERAARLEKLKKLQNIYRLWKKIAHASSLLVFLIMSGYLILHDHCKLPFEDEGKGLTGGRLEDWYEALEYHGNTWEYFFANPWQKEVFWVRNPDAKKCIDRSGKFAKCSLKNLWTWDSKQRILSFPHYYEGVGDKRVCLNQACEDCAVPPVSVGNCSDDAAWNWRFSSRGLAAANATYPVLLKDVHMHEEIGGGDEGEELLGGVELDAVQLGARCVRAGKKMGGLVLGDSGGGGGCVPLAPWKVSVDYLLGHFDPDRDEADPVLASLFSHRYTLLWLAVAAAALAYCNWAYVKRELAAAQRQTRDLMRDGPLGKAMQRKVAVKKDVAATKMQARFRGMKCRVEYQRIKKQREILAERTAGPYWPEHGIFEAWRPKPRRQASGELKEGEDGAAEEKEGGAPKQGFLGRAAAFVGDTVDLVRHSDTLDVLDDGVGNEKALRAIEEREKLRALRQGTEPGEHQDGPAIEHQHASVADMVEGDYLCVVHVIEVSDLVGVEWNGTSDPYVQVDCLGQVEKTEHKNKQNDAHFDSMFNFRFDNYNPENLEDGEIILRVFDNNQILSDKLIGSQSINPMEVYRQKDHMVWKQRWALVDSTSTSIKGWITATVAVLGPGEEFKEYHVDDPVPHYTLSVVPDTVPRKMHTVIVNLFWLEDLPLFKTAFGKSTTNAYVRIDLGEEQLKTEPISKARKEQVDGREVLRWDKKVSMRFPVAVPFSRKHIFLSVWAGGGTYDQLIGYRALEFSDIPDRKKGDFGAPRWVNLYNPSESATNSTLKSFNASRFLTLDDFETEFSGRVLVAMHKELPDKKDEMVAPEIDTKTLPNLFQKMKKDSPNVPATASYCLKFAITYGTNLPATNKYYRVRLAIGTYEVKTTASKMRRGGYINWQETLHLHDIMLPKAISMMQDVFLYLEKVDNPRSEKSEIVSLERYSISELLFKGEPGIGFLLVYLRWANFQEKKPEPPITPGALMVRLALSPQEQINHDSDFDALENVENVLSTGASPATSPPKANNVQSAGTSPSTSPQSLETLPLTTPAARPSGTPREVKILKAKDKKSSWFGNSKMPSNLDAARESPFQWSIPEPLTEGSTGTDTEFQLRVHIYQAHDLPIADSNGTSDPFIEISYMGRIERTKVHVQTRDPVFYETLSFDLTLPNRILDMKEEDIDTLLPPIKLIVWDKDTLTNDCLGTTFVRVSDAKRFCEVDPRHSKEFPLPKYYELYLNHEQQGRVLASAQLVYQSDPRAGEMPDIEPEKFDASLEVTAVGLRGLVSDGLISIEKPYIVFESDAANKKGKDTLFETKSSKTPDPMNPNFAEVRTINVPLPENPLFAPTISMRVMDHHIGRPDTLIGFARIPLAGKVTEFFKGQNEKLIDTVRIAFNASSNSSLANNSKPSLISKLSSGRLGKASPSPSPGDDLDHVKEFNNTLKTNSPAGTLKTTFQRAHIVNEQQYFQNIKQIEDGPYAHIKNHMKNRSVLGSTWSKVVEGKPFENIIVYRMDPKSKMPDTVGKFKGTITIHQASNKIDEGKAKERKPSTMTNKDRGADYKVRLYVLRAFNLQAVGSSEKKLDPYVKVELQAKKTQQLGSRDDHVTDNNSPEFFKAFELDAHLPGPSQVRVSVWDHEAFSVKGDQLIGETWIDLEDRWFDKRWQKWGMHYECNDRLAPKPIEKRKLEGPHSKSCTGQLELWVDIIPTNKAKKYEQINIALPPPGKFQVRVIVWETKEVVSFDHMSGMNDLYIKVWLQGQEKKKKQTDTHWRAKHGKGSFNYRMTFDVELGLAPAKDSILLKSPKLFIQAWDRDVIKFDDHIGQGNVEMKNLISCYQSMKPQHLFDHKKTPEELEKENKAKEREIKRIKAANKRTSNSLNLFSIVLLLVVVYIGMDTARTIGESKSSKFWTKYKYQKLLQRIDEVDEIYTKIFYIRDPEDNKCLGRRRFRECTMGSVWGVQNSSLYAWHNTQMTFSITGFPPAGPVDINPELGGECLSTLNTCKQKGGLKIKATPKNCALSCVDTWNYIKRNKKVMINDLCLMRKNDMPMTVNCTRTVKGKLAYTKLKIVETTSSALMAVASLRLDALCDKQGWVITIWRACQRQQKLLIYVGISLVLFSLLGRLLKTYHDTKLDEKETDTAKISDDKANAREMKSTAKSYLGYSENKERKADWVEITRNDPKEGRKRMGFVLLSCEVVPGDVARGLPVGEGRDAPNQAPYLPPPTGRLRFTLNPFTLLTELLGAELFLKLGLGVLFLVVVPLGYFGYSYLKPYIKLVIAFIETII